MKADVHHVKKTKARNTVFYIFRVLALARTMISNCGLTARLVAATIADLCDLRPEIEYPLLHATFSPSKRDRLPANKRKAIAYFIHKELKLPPGWPVIIVLHERRNNRNEPHFHFLIPLINDQGIRLPNPASYLPENIARDA